MTVEITAPSWFLGLVGVYFVVDAILRLCLLYWKRKLVRLQQEVRD